MNQIKLILMYGCAEQLRQICSNDKGLPYDVFQKVVFHMTSPGLKSEMSPLLFMIHKTTTKDSEPRFEDNAKKIEYLIVDANLSLKKFNEDPEFSVLKIISTSEATNELQYRLLKVLQTHGFLQSKSSNEYAVKAVGFLARNKNQLLVKGVIENNANMFKVPEVCAEIFTTLKRFSKSETLEIFNASLDTGAFSDPLSVVNAVKIFHKNDEMDLLSVLVKNRLKVFKSDKFQTLVANYRKECPHAEQLIRFLATLATSLL